ncbi:MAG: 6-phosphogluconolactonase [Planctomycetota bacterium]|nr:6-phosphogluconolactonase [Planctomycetota bacterium]
MPEEHSYQPDPDREIETYDLIEETSAVPGLPGSSVVAETIDKLMDFVTRDLCHHAMQTVQEFGDFHLALSGGRTPLPLYQRLMIDPDCRLMPWRRTHLWMVDERCVPPTDPQSNYPDLDETIVAHADIPREQVHPIMAMSETADVDYEKQIHEALEWREDETERRMDYVLLGMGEDGHTASLFPHTPALGEKERWIRFNTSMDASPAERITMTYPIINTARFVAILVTGSNKAAMIQRVASGEDTFEDLPILGARPTNGMLRWYLDKAACATGLLDEKAEADDE